MAKGLYEAEARSHDGRNDLLITLYRSVDTIGSAAGANYDVEHAKVSGPLRFEVALSPSRTVVETARKAAEFTTPLLTHGTCLAPAIPCAPVTSMVSAKCMFNCLKPAEDGNGFVLRFYNLTDEPDRVEFKLGPGKYHISRVNLSENPLPSERWQRLNGGVIYETTPYEIVTLRLVKESAGQQ